MEKLKPSVSGKPPSRKTPSQPAHALKYGLEIVLRDKTGVVCSVECLFCRYFGREEALGSKRKRTQNVRTYKPPYRPQSYVEHNETAHPEKWGEYGGLNDADKVDFFKDRTPPKNQLSAHFGKESACVRFSFPAKIVEVLLGNLFFNAEDEEATVATALRAFGPKLDGKYSVVIKTPLRFTLAVQHLSVGLSFRQTAEVIRQHHCATGNHKLYGMTDNFASTYARILVAASFQQIGFLLAEPRMWAFAFASDVTTHTDQSFMDQRVRLAVNGVLVNLHLLAIPMFDRHTAVVQRDLIVAVLDILFESWRDKLIGIASDGENTMTGRHGGVVTLLEKEATHRVLRVWCAAHQLDLVLKAGFALISDGEFVKKTKDVIVHLRKQKTLITEMGSAAKKLTNRWLYMGNALNWIVSHHVRLAKHFDDHKSELPTSAWWVNAAAVKTVMALVNATFIKIQSKDLILSQQMAEIELLATRLKSLLFVLPRPSGDVLPGSNDVVSSKYWLQERRIVEFVEDQGSFTRSHLRSLPPNDKSSLLRQLGEFILHIIDGIELVQAERDSNNAPAENLAPPVMPSLLVEMRPREFGEVILEPRKPQLSKFWDTENIAAIEQEHLELCTAAMINQHVQDVLQKETYDTSFNDGWDALQKVQPGKYGHLRQFCCGLATVFANTASVESDFSILKWELGDRRTQLTSLALEGIFQAKQSKILGKL